MIVKKKVCFCPDTEKTVDISNVKEVWVATKWSYDKYAKQMLPLKKKSIGLTSRDVLHQINPEVAPSWREAAKGKDSLTLMEGVDISVAPSKIVDTEQYLYASKDQLLSAIKKNLVKKPNK